MKDVWRRLRYYGFGFGIGLIFVFFFFQNRGCSWLPENRVKNTMMGKILVISPETQKKLHLSDEQVVSFLNDGAISFRSSKKQGDPKVYSFKKEMNGKTVELWFTISDNSYISEVLVPHGNIQKSTNSRTGLGRMIHFPNVKNFVYLVDNQQLNKQLEKYGIQDELTIQYLIKKGGLIDFSKSKLETKPYGEHYLLIPRSSGDTLKSRTIWFQDHIQFQFFED